METEQLKSAAIEATHAGNISEARSMWLQLCEIDPKENENWLLLSNIDARLGFLQAARNHLNFPIRNNAFDRDIWELAASQSFELGKFDEALRLLHRVLRQDFTDVTVRQKLGDWCLRLNRRRIAACHFMYCVQLTPNDEDLLAKLICSLIVRDDISEACQGLSFLASLNEDQITNRACDSAVELWLSLQTPGTVSSVKVPQTTATSLINKKLANASSRNIENAEHYYSYTAHIRAYTKDVHQEVLARHIAKLSFPTEQGVCSIVEMGAGVGTLGKELCKIEAQTSHAKSSYITGVCLVGEEQHYLNQNTAYDLVVSFDHLMQHVNTISCDVLIINEQVSRFLNEGQLEEVSEILAPKSILAIVGRPELLTAWLRDNCDQTIVRENGTFILCNQVLESRSSESQATQCLRKSEMEPVIKAMQAVRSGQYDKAVDLSHDFQPDLDRYPSVQFLRGITAQHQKQYKSAAIHFMRCLRSDPAYVDARFHLAACWQSLDKEHAMQRTYRRVLKASSGHQLAAKNLISHYAHLKDFDQVGIFVQQLLLNHPIDGQMRNYASQVVEDSGKQDFKVWLQQFYQQENFLRAAFQESLSNKYFKRAERILKFLKSRVSSGEAESLSVSLAEKSGNLSQAIALMDNIVEHKPEDLAVRTRRRSLLMASGRQERALESWRYEITRFDGNDPNFSGALFVGNYFAELKPEELAEHHKRWGKKVEKKDVEAELSKRLKPLHAIDPSRKKIRIGYLSGDFKTHSVSLFLYNLYLHHDREKFEIVSYSTNRSKDIWALKYELLSDSWREVGHLSTTRLVNRIRRDELDILVDLSGHTGHHRLRALALRCAPLQGTYLGYANTTGLSAVDFRFSDEVADPRDQDVDLHTEQIKHIEGGFLSYRREFSSPPVSFIGDQSEPVERHYNYVCCNNVYKITPVALKLFSEILLQHEGSVMLIKAHNLDNADLREDLYSRFQGHGVSPDRVHLMNALDLDDHQALYNYTDVALDPFPYNGTTTSCDTLWMGVPTITLRGDRHAARVGASILTMIGREEWIAESHEEYIQKAVQLCKDKHRLRKEKMSLRKDMLNSTLMIPHHTVGKIEGIYSRLVEELK